MYNVTARHARGVSRRVTCPVISCMMPAMIDGETVLFRAATRDMG
jgi:hypothetical protein